MDIANLLTYSLTRKKMVVPRSKPDLRKQQHSRKISRESEMSDAYFPSDNNISHFYVGLKIFITGATGFVGKALVEKLLRSCSELDSIYLLMRPKRGMTIDQRLNELFKSPIYNKIREKNPASFEKVKAVCGDVSQENLGLSDEDKDFLQENIHIVFHSAATIKFNEDLKNAIIINTLGTQKVVKLCEQMKVLKGFVHVSTAYSNSDKQDIEEVVYKPKLDPEAILSCMELLSPEAINILSKKVQGKHPNTYTITKAMAEYIVSESSSIIPAAVVRPSIITAAWREPFPGWVDNLSGISGIFMECGRGTIKTILCNEECTMDIIPVDIVVNTIITAAWHTSVARSNAMRVYNCTSGNFNPVSWKQFGSLTHKYSLMYPSKYVTWYPGFSYRTNRLTHALCSTLYHTIPSFLLDVYLISTGQKPMMLKISRKFDCALEAGSFFATNNWNFQTSTMESLIDAVGEAEDHAEFPINIGSDEFSWEYYVEKFILGVRKYILKDDLSTLPRAKTKLNRLFWFQKIVQVATAYAALKIVLNR